MKHIKKTAKKNDEAAEVMIRVRDSLETLGAKYRVLATAYNELQQQVEKLEVHDPFANSIQQTDYTDFELGVIALERPSLLRGMGNIQDNFSRLLYTQRLSEEANRCNPPKPNHDASEIPF